MQAMGEDVTFSGTATTTVAFVIIKDKRNHQSFARRLLISNDDATNNLLYSTDNGASFSVLKPGLTAEILGTSIMSFGVKSAAATAAWSVHAAVA